MKRISDAEGIKITDDAARVIARVSRGGMRDAISLLELCAGAHKEIDDRLVFSTVGSGNRDNAYKIIEAVGSSDYETVYSIIDEIVMSSGDLSVFWQEIIDSYRDIMVVKTVERAKSYLDLTDVENEALKKIASAFTMQKLFYHTSLLERALEDMQRAFNSKRSIAEIALTRMCDPTLSSSSEALALRVEELEKTVSMLKLGVSAPSKTADGDDAVKVLPTVKESVLSVDTPPKGLPEVKKISADKKWGDVLEKIAELKKSLSVQFIGAKAYQTPDGAFMIRMNPFFATKLAGSEPDLALLRGIIAEFEGISRDGVKLLIEPLDSSHNDDLADELEDALK